MKNQTNACFFEIEEIPEDSLIFEQLKKQELFFSYFQVDRNYYLFFYGQTHIDIDLIEPQIQILQELDRKQRQVRSLRGFFLYALEIMENGKDFQILETNLKPSFWRNLKNILRQNKKSLLIQFLFGDSKSRADSYQGSSPNSDITKVSEVLEAKIQNLQTQVNFLQQKIIDLEAKLENPKYALSATLESPEATKIIQQADSTLKPNMGSYLQENDTKINQQVQEPISKSVSEASKSPVTTSKRSEEYNTLGKISEDEQIEIIKQIQIVYFNGKDIPLNMKAFDADHCLNDSTFSQNQVLKIKDSVGKMMKYALSGR